MGESESKLRRQLRRAVEQQEQVEAWLSSPYDGTGSPPGWFPDRDREQCLAIQRRILSIPGIRPIDLRFWMECWAAVLDKNHRPEIDRIPIEFREDVAYLNTLLDAFTLGPVEGLKVLTSGELVNDAESGKRSSSGRRLGAKTRAMDRRARLDKIKGAMNAFMMHRPDARAWTLKAWVRDWPGAHPSAAKRVFQVGKKTNGKTYGYSRATFECDIKTALSELRKDRGTPKKRTMKS